MKKSGLLILLICQVLLAAARPSMALHTATPDRVQGAAQQSGKLPFQLPEQEELPGLEKAAAELADECQDLPVPSAPLPHPLPQPCLFGEPERAGYWPVAGDIQTPPPEA